MYALYRTSAQTVALVLDLLLNTIQMADFDLGSFNQARKEDT